jgi:serine/threonine protein kinase
MADVIYMPLLSDTMTEGKIVKWNKQVGDKVKRDDVLADVETDKATMEVVGNVAGILLHIGVKEGAAAKVNEIIAIIGSEGEDISSLLGSVSTGPKITTNQDINCQIKLKDFNLLSILGKGGMATVYLAENRKFDVHVAVKMLNQEHVQNKNVRERFFSEAKLLYRLSHPNIVKATDLIDDGEMAAYVMDYVEGETLKDYVQKKGRLGDEEIRGLFMQMFDAVGFVHENQLVHRDIKPSNFMIGKNGKVKLMDFGIVKNLDPTAAEYTMTATTQQMGTPMYMSPEQVKSSKSVTTRSDIYSLGVVLWQMVTGRRPYDSDTLSTFDIQLKIVTEPLDSTSTNWDRLIEKATQKNPEARFQSCLDFREVLNSGTLFDVSPDVKESSDATIVGTTGKYDRTVIDNSIPSDVLLEGSVLDGNGNMKYGLVDLKGGWVIQPVFDYLLYYDGQNYCKASLDGKWGYIDRRGNWIIQPMFDRIDNYDAQGYCQGVIDGKYGIVDKRGNWIIQPTFDYLFSFDDQNYCAARLNEKFGFIDRNGKWIFPPQFDYLGGFDDQNYCMASLDGKCGFIDRRGNWIIQPMFDSIDNNYDEQGYCKVAIDGKYGFIDRKGNWLIQPMFNHIRSISFDCNGYVRVALNGKYGIVDRKGNWIIQPVFDSVKDFDEKGYCRVCENGKYGFVDTKGNWIIRSIFDYLKKFDENGYCRAELNKRNGFIDREGNWIIQPLFDSLGSFDDQNYCAAEFQGKYGFIDRNGNWIIPPTYDSLGSYNDIGLCEIKNNNRKGFIDRNGKMVIQADWLCEQVGSNLFKVSHGRKYGYKSYSNEWVVNPVFDYILSGNNGPMIWNETSEEWQELYNTPQNSDRRVS